MGVRVRMLRRVPAPVRPGNAASGCYAVHSAASCSCLCRRVLLVCSRLHACRWLQSPDGLTFELLCVELGCGYSCMQLNLLMPCWQLSITLLLLTRSSGWLLCCASSKPTPGNTHVRQGVLCNAAWQALAHSYERSECALCGTPASLNCPGPMLHQLCIH
jgi:hypothetical protein